MKSISKILVAIIMLLSSVVGYAKIKNAKTETIKIYGNCEMCENTIEKAGNRKNIAEVDWNIDSKMATITYDTQKTNLNEILKRIALAGYDSDQFLAPDKVYAHLPNCCQYARAKKEIPQKAEMKMAENNHSMHANPATNQQESNPLLGVFNNYFVLKNTLVSSDGTAAAASAKTLLDEINAVNMEALPMDVHMVWMKVLGSLKEDTKHIANTKDIAYQRDYFMALSKNFYEVMKLSKLESPVYYQYCPMANEGKGANWLSKESAIKNPYYGSQMLNCGKTVDTIK